MAAVRWTDRPILTTVHAMRFGVALRCFYVKPNAPTGRTSLEPQAHIANHVPGKAGRPLAILLNPEGSTPIRIARVLSTALE